MEEIAYSRAQLCALLLLRLSIGWHFLYEGISKLLIPDWSARGYLLDSQGFLSDLFHALALQKELLAWVDLLNIVLLTWIGFCLISGLLCRWAAWTGVILTGIYYLSHIPFIGASYQMPAEGTYLWIDKNLIEAFAFLVLIYFPTSQLIGIDRFFQKEDCQRKG